MSELIVNGRPIPYETVPVPHMADGMRRYFEKGIPPGSFGTALLCNDLRGVFQRADAENAECIRQWVMWLYANAPNGSWGSPQAFNAWLTERQKVAA